MIDEIAPLAGAASRSIAHRLRLLDMAGEMLSSSQVEALLGITRHAIGRRRKNRKLFAVRLESDWLYPGFQFSADDVLPGLQAVLKAHKENDPWVVLDILLASDDALGGRTLLCAIREGDQKAVARHIAQVNGVGFA